MSNVDLRPLAGASGLRAERSRWPLAVAAAGLLGFGATGLSDHDVAVVQRAGSVVTLGAALLLVVAAACWRRFVEPRTRSSTAAHVVPLALVASAAGLALGHEAGWVGVAGAAAAVAWMALRERSVSRPVGLLSVLAAVAVPAAPAVAAPSWLVLAGFGLAFGRSTIAR